MGGQKKEIETQGDLLIINLELADFIFEGSKYTECMKVARKYLQTCSGFSALFIWNYSCGHTSSYF